MLITRIQMYIFNIKILVTGGTMSFFCAQQISMIEMHDRLYGALLKICTRLPQKYHLTEKMIIVQLSNNRSVTSIHLVISYLVFRIRVPHHKVKIKWFAISVCWMCYCSFIYCFYQIYNSITYVHLFITKAPSLNFRNLPW